MTSSSKIGVLVVDDSAFFRKRLVEMLNKMESIEVIGEAENGLKAVQLSQRLHPDVITMDVEMPVMDGITAVKRIMADMPTAILMLSSLTREGATATLDALDAGAADFLLKDFGNISAGHEAASTILAERIFALARRSHRQQPPSVAKVQTQQHAPSKERYQLVVIGASTGGPVALQTILTSLPADFPLPILLVVHMPANFTSAFAKRLNAQSRITVKEAVDGDPLKPGVALLAPGGTQMTTEQQGRSRSVVRIKEADSSQTYRPSVDVTFSSLANLYRKKVLAVVLTGMGADGLEGARLLKSNGSSVWSQNEASCVVFGMPQAVQKAGLSDRVLPVDQIGAALVKAV